MVSIHKMVEVHLDLGSPSRHRAFNLWWWAALHNLLNDLVYLRCLQRLSLFFFVFLALFLSLSDNIKQGESSSESEASDGSDSDESEELDEEEELDEDGSESGFGLGTVLRRGRGSSWTVVCGVVNVAK